MAEQYVGSWKRLKIENHEAYMRAVGCDEQTVQAALIADKEESTLEVTLDGEHFTWNQENAGKKWPHTFTLDKEEEHSSPHGSYKSVVTMEGNKMIGKGVPNQRWIEGDRFFEIGRAEDVELQMEFIRV